MKSLLLVCFTIITFAVQAQNFQSSIPKDYGYIVELGQIAPDFTLDLPDGSKTSIQALRGKVVMLQFTASWCSVCRKEMPHIENDIWEKHKDNKDFALYGIDLKEDAKTIIEFKQSIGITYPLALDLNGDIFALFAHKNAGVTRNIIIDKSGKIVFMTRLFKEAEFEAMTQVIDTLLAK